MSDKDWTVMVYMAGDNNLTEEMIWGLQEMKKASEDKDIVNAVNLVAQFDARGYDPIRYDIIVKDAAAIAKPEKDGNLHELPKHEYKEDGVQETIRRSISRDCLSDVKDEKLKKKLVEKLAATLKASHDYTAGAIVKHLAKTAKIPGKLKKKIEKRLVSKLERTSEYTSSVFSSSAMVEDFIESQIELLPKARNYMAILSGHGSGAVGDFLSDQNPGSSLSIPMLGKLLGKALEAYGRKYPDDNGNKRIAILGMDSCLMSMAEVCYEVREYVDYLVGSEGFVLNTGWPYHRVLQAMSDGPEPKMLAQRIVHKYIAFYRDYEGAGLSTDMSVCALAPLRNHAGLRHLMWSLARRLASALKNLVVMEELERLGRHPEKHLENAKGKMAEKKSDTLNHLVSAKQIDKNDSKALQGLDSIPPLDDGYKYEELKQKLTGLVQSDDEHVAKSIEELGIHDEDELLDRLLHFKTKGDTMEPRVANALVELRMELEYFVFKPRDTVLKVLSKLDMLESRGAGAARALKEAMRLLDEIKRLGVLVELRAKNRIKDSRKDWNEVRHSVAFAHSRAQSYKGEQYVDLYDFCDQLSQSWPTEGGIGRLCKDIKDKIEQELVVKSCYSGPDFQHSHGLSVYFPSKADDYSHEYGNLEFAKDTGWDDLVIAYLKAARRERRPVENQDLTTEVIRFGLWDHDPLVKAGTNDRVRAGTNDRVRAGTNDRVRAGTNDRVRAGTNDRVRAGTNDRIRGKVVGCSFKSPPDGFYRSECKEP